MRKNGTVDTTEFRPSLLGFDHTAAGFLQVANQLVSLRMEQGNHKLKHLPGPKFPMEIVDERLRQFAKQKRDDAIVRAQEAAAKAMMTNA